MTIADTIHLHGIHGGPPAMDGVAGMSQPMVEPGGRFRYAFRADQPGTFIYHCTTTKQTVNSGLYGAIVVLPAHPRPEERVQRDDVEMLSSWTIQSTVENHFTLNGKEYPGDASDRGAQGRPRAAALDQHVRRRTCTRCTRTGTTSS